MGVGSREGVKSEKDKSLSAYLCCVKTVESTFCSTEEKREFCPDIPWK